MTLLYYHPHFLHHETGAHPECATRLEQIISRLEGSGLAAQCERPVWQSAPDDWITRVHDVEYVAELRSLASRGGGRPEPDTVVSPASVDAATLAAGAACDAVDGVIQGQQRRALCLVRPPGHHALKASAMGFCLLGNVAIAARHAINDLGLDRVLIVDWDVHHGNGTQALFYDDPRVGFFSIHRWPFYPGSGAEDETGTADGLGATRNLPVTMGTSRDRYLSWFTRELDAFAEHIRPQIVLISAGFDSHREDPIGSIGLETEDFCSLTQTVMDIAAVHADGRLVSVLEGGYNPPVLADCVALHLSEMLERDSDELK